MTDNHRASGGADVRAFHPPHWTRRGANRRSLVAFLAPCDPHYDERCPVVIVLSDVFGREWLVYSPHDGRLTVDRGMARSHAGAVMDADAIARRVWDLTGDCGAAESVML